MDETQFIRQLRDVLIISGRVDSVETHEHDPQLAHNEIRVDGSLRLVAEPEPGRSPPERRPVPRTGVNPVTFTPRVNGHPMLVISRLHLATAGRTSAMRGPAQKTVTVMMHHGSTTNEDLVGLAIFNEDHIIDGLLHLFPYGELVPREETDSGQQWPMRQTVWETADGELFQFPDLAQQHQEGLDREITRGGEGEFNAWYIIETPSGRAEIAKARKPDDINNVRRGVAVIAGYKLYTGFPTKDDARVFAQKKNLEVLDGD